MKKYILLAFIGLLGLTSCDDTLDVTPRDKVGIDEYFRTSTDLELFSNTFYNSLLDKKPYSYQDDHIVKQTLSSELLCGSSRTVPASGGGWTWTVLRKINTLLEYAPKNCTDADAVKKYTAVGRFFRAHFYFEKVKRFGDVPWVDRQLFSTDDKLYGARDSRELVMGKIIEDLDYAIENLPSSSTEKSVYRVTQGAALALKSQVCLFEGTFRKYHGLSLDGHDYEWYLRQCVDASEKLMSGAYGKYALYNTGKPAQDYRDLFVFDQASDSKTEVIIAVAYNVGLSIFHNASAYCVLDNQGKPAVTRKLVSSYLMKDGSRFTDKVGWETMQFADEMKDRDPRLSQSIRGTGYIRVGEKSVESANLLVSSTGYQPIKFVTQKVYQNNEVDRSGRSYNDMPVYRYAEVLLNFAEAKAELGELSQGDLDKSVNLIRKRAGMPDMKTGNSVDPFLISQDFGYSNCKDGDILEIRRERGIELFMEHRRYYDLMRWKEGKCINQPIYGIYVNGAGGIDFTGDGREDVVFYANGGSKPAVGAGVQTYEIGKDIILSQDSKGYSCNHHTQDRKPFDENRDYLYPIPTNELSLNPNLTQNPGWK